RPWRAEVAQEDVLQHRSRDPGAGLRAAAGAAGDRRRGRLVPRQRLSEMTAIVAGPSATDAGTVEAPSGKGRGDENFPVGSWLIRRDLRVHVHAFYSFARNADDIADSPVMAADDKLRRLDRMAAILDGAPGPADADSSSAAAMRES